MTLVLTLPEIFELSKAALVGSGASATNADPVARSVHDAEAEGFRNGGLVYLPHYCEHLRGSRVNGRAAPAVRVQAPAAIQVDADSGFCHAAFVLAEQSSFGSSVTRASRASPSLGRIRPARSAGSSIAWHAQAWSAWPLRTPPRW